MRYLSEQWRAAANTAVSELTPLPISLVAGYVVTGADPYSICLGPDAVSIQQGLAGADVTFACDWDLACAVATGKRSAQRAFLDGDLTVEGNVNVLLGNTGAFAAIEDCLAPLRAKATYND